MVDLLIFPTRIMLALIFTFTQHFAIAGVIGKDQRQWLVEYAKSKNLTLDEARNRFEASGRIKCGWGEGSGFLVGGADIVVTARHVIFPPSSVSKSTAIEFCEFGFWTGREWHVSRFRSFALPSKDETKITDPYDWIAIKLLDPIPDVAPFKISTVKPVPGTDVTVVSGFQHTPKFANERERIVEECHVQNLLKMRSGLSGVLETDCSASEGASGSPLLVDTLLSR